MQTNGHGRVCLALGRFLFLQSFCTTLPPDTYLTVWSPSIGYRRYIGILRPGFFVPTKRKRYRYNNRKRFGTKCPIENKIFLFYTFQFFSACLISIVCVGLREGRFFLFFVWWHEWSSLGDCIVFLLEHQILNDKRPGFFYNTGMQTSKQVT